MGARKSLVKFFLFATGILALSAATGCEVPGLDAQAPGAGRPKPEINQVGARAHIDQNYGKLPLSFEPNLGQTDGRVKFLSRGRGFSLFLTPTEAVLSLQKPGKERPPRVIPSLARNLMPPSVAKAAFSGLAGKATEKPEVSVLRVKLVGANRNPQIEGIDPLPG